MAAFALWAVLVGCGWAWMARYSTTPGAQALAPSRLPAEMRQLTNGTAQPLLFVALHPQCSCSRATMHELRRVLRDTPGARPAVYLLLYRPANPPAEWADDSTLPALLAGLNAHAVTDTQGRYAEALHAATSGEVILYSRDGQLLFQGGLTALRGHEGPSAGAEHLQAALKNGIFSTLSSVFGCPIFHRNEHSPAGQS